MVSVVLLKLFLILYPEPLGVRSSSYVHSVEQCCHRSSVKIFPHEGETWPFFPCCICISCTFLTEKGIQWWISEKIPCCKLIGSLVLLSHTLIILSPRTPSQYQSYCVKSWLSDAGARGFTPLSGPVI